MPDAARLVAAICIGLLAFVVSRMIMPLMPESTAFGHFVLVNSIIGIVAGWVVMGKRAGRGITAAINNGLAGAMTLVIWGLFLHACYAMFDKALDNWYKNAFDALIAVFELMADYGLVLINGPIILTLIGGGIIAGLLTELAWRTWR